MDRCTARSRGGGETARRPKPSRLTAVCSSAREGCVAGVLASDSDPFVPAAGGVEGTACSRSS
eukprot:4183399-Pleurochrysis_carterae.AAC.1